MYVTVLNNTTTGFQHMSINRYSSHETEITQRHVIDLSFCMHVRCLRETISENKNMVWICIPFCWETFNDIPFVIIVVSHSFLPQKEQTFFKVKSTPWNRVSTWLISIILRCFHKILATAFVSNDSEVRRNAIKCSICKIY